MGYNKYEIGAKIGDVTFLGDEPTKDRRRSRFKCFCGVEFIALMYQVIRGNRASCGCLRSTSQIKHGHAKGGDTTLTYGSWKSMKERCDNPNGKNYKYWGGAGVKICSRWYDFDNFIADMGERPSVLHTIDRFPNKDGDYEPGNCRWATKKEQANNQRNNVVVEFDEVKMTLGQWSDKLGIRRTVLGNRIKNMGVERALTEPLRKKRPNHT